MMQLCWISAKGFILLTNLSKEVCVATDYSVYCLVVILSKFHHCNCSENSLSKVGPTHIRINLEIMSKVYEFVLLKNSSSPIQEV